MYNGNDLMLQVGGGVQCPLEYVKKRKANFTHS